MILYFTINNHSKIDNSETRSILFNKQSAHPRNFYLYRFPFLSFPENNERASLCVILPRIAVESVATQFILLQRI